MKSFARRTWKIAAILIISMAALQLFPRPLKNTSTTTQPANVQYLAQLPDTVSALLKRACNDCHSNNTNYPWYTNIQPLTWYLNKHIVEGKKELNFDEFLTYSRKKQISKLESIADQVREGAMPLTSYTLIHTGAGINKVQQQLIINWATTTAALLEQKQ
jgi:hypothetical protein